MKKRLLFFTVLIMILQQAHSQTNIIGGVVEGTWTKLNSPYIIQGAILVPDSKILIIEPGVKVEFQGSYKFSIQGQINAIGTVNDSITFTTNNPSVGWLGIRFENTPTTNDTSNFSYCKFEHGRANSPSPLDSGGALFIDGYSKVNLSHSLIENCYAKLNGGGIYCNNGSSPLIMNNTIRRNTSDNLGGGIYAGDLCSPEIKNNIIMSNIVKYNAGGGIYIYDNYGSASPIVDNNIISYNVGESAFGAGIRVYSNAATITNNVITFNESNNDLGGGGLAIRSKDASSHNIVSYNVIANNKTLNDMEDFGGGGIRWFSTGPNDILSNNLIANNSTSKDGGGILIVYSSPIMINNTIVNNSARNGGGLICKNSSSPIIKNSIIWGNTASSLGNQLFLEDEGSDPDIHFSNIEGGISGVQSAANTFYLGEYLNNINSDPLFNNPSSGAGSNFDGFSSDWTLNSSTPSPCINQVSPTNDTSPVDLSGNPRVFEDLIDMGCYESQDNTLSIDEISRNTFSIYPIPAANYIKINGQGQINKLVIYNLQGQIVKEYSTINKQEKINISSLISGIYLVQLNNSISYKILKK